jgi:hypothetical protein
MENYRFAKQGEPSFLHKFASERTDLIGRSLDFLEKTAQVVGVGGKHRFQQTDC